MGARPHEGHRRIENMNLRWLSVAFAATAFGWLGPARSAVSAEEDDQGPIPVVMEEATVRGRVVIMETRRTERHALEGLRVKVWTKGNKEGGEESRLLHEAETDELGLFSLPLLPVGEYTLVVSKVTLRLVVTPKAPERAEQEEPKILLILLPREVI